MSIDKTGMISATQSSINTANSSCATCDLVALSATTNRITTDRKSYIALGCDLPDLNLGTTPEGTMFYVQELNLPVVATDQAWTGLDGRTYRKDIPDVQLWGWGQNGYFSTGLGDGAAIDRSSPVREVTSSINWQVIEAGQDHSLGIKKDGSLWAWGSNNSGRLGNNTTTNRSSPTREITSSTDWCAVSGGTIHTAAIKTSGQLWTFGNNGYGNLGDSSTAAKSSPVREFSSSSDWNIVSAGSDFTAAVKTSGQIWSWGNNTFGQLGNGDNQRTSSPVRERCSSVDWCLVSGGAGFSVAIKTSGQLWAWGRNNNGRLGDGTTVTRSSPVREITSSTNWCVASTSSAHVLAVKTSNELWAWGWNGYGRLGDNTTVDKCSPVREITSSTDWCAVGAGYSFSTAIKTSGQIWTWGRNNCGFLGDNTVVDKCSPVREISSATNWSKVSAGYRVLATKVV